MRLQLAQLSALLFSILLMVSGNAFLMTLLGVRLSGSGTTTNIIGWVLLCYFIGFVIGTLYADRVIRRVGHIRAFAVFAATTAAAALLYPYLDKPIWWAGLRVISGLSMAGLLVVVESWFSARATNSNRATLFAIYQIAFYIASAGGQLLINIGDPLTFAPFTLAGILLIIALIPLSLTRVQAPSIEHVEHLPLRRLLHLVPLGMITSLASGLVINAFYALGPVYATQIALSLGELSIFMALAVIVAMLFAWPLGWISDRVERRHALMWVALGAALASISTALFGEQDYRLLLLCTGLFMGLTAALYPLAVAMVNDRMDSREIVAASAGLLLSYGIGACLGPALGSLMMTLFGPSGLFLGNGVILLALVPLSRYWITQVKPLPLAEQEHFVAAMPATTPVLAGIDPRNEAFEEAALSEPEDERRAAPTPEENPVAGEQS
ncbi:MAG: MFS transporter [Spongiibacteraceae bacterium]|nr:MFS transporter [Spongiibacteraceae bacterium]